MLDTGFWMLDKIVARETQPLAPHVAFLPFIKSTECLVDPVSSIQYQPSSSITDAVFLFK
jgi:hypothetical protein